MLQCTSFIIVDSRDFIRDYMIMTFFLLIISTVSNNFDGGDKGQLESA